MKKSFGKIYEIDDDIRRVDFPAVRQWLAQTYWSPGISLDEVVRGAENSSLVVGCYRQEGQAGFLRVVSDKTRFAYIMDVIVDPARRGGGIGREMTRFALEHPDYSAVYQWALATQDAHGVYATLGFTPLPEPERWMINRKPKTW